MTRYQRLVFASEYALARYRLTGSGWWEERYLTLERERQGMLRKP